MSAKAPAAGGQYPAIVRMRTTSVLLLIGLGAMTVLGGSTLPRQRRQSWGFPEETSTTLRFPTRPPSTTPTNSRVTTRTTTRATTRTTARAPPTAQPGGSTSTSPAGTIFQVRDCACQAPPQYNPVCGSDGNTYVNRQKLECTRRCGFNVTEARMGAC